MRRAFLGMMLMSGVAACTTAPSGPRVTRVVVNKSDRMMFLMDGRKATHSYPIDLGFSPIGDKFVEGDGRTPEGHYIIDRRNPFSRFYLSLGISYPRPRDIAEARRLGKSPGGEIFIHGEPNDLPEALRDWTAGCIAVDNASMKEIWDLVEVGTPITINP